jgi:hypothetical protein
LEEIQILLQEWYTLAGYAAPITESFSPAAEANAIIYHLIVLNTNSFSPDIERLARGEVDPDKFQAKSRYVDDAEEIFVHCGQVLRHIGIAPENARPP